MKIRQEVWSPALGWSTVNNRGSLHQASIVFCNGNIGVNFSGSLFREIKHAFPNACIVFTTSKRSIDNKLYLTALSFEKTSFSLFNYNSYSGSMELLRRSPFQKESSKNIRQILFCSALTKEKESQVAEDLKEKFAFNTIEKSGGESLFSVGLNQVPSSETAFGIAFHDNNINIQPTTILTKETMDATSVAAQALPIPASLRFIESGDNNPAFIPVNHTFLLKR